MKPLWQQMEDEADQHRIGGTPWALILALLLLIIGLVLLSC